MTGGAATSGGSVTHTGTADSREGRTAHMMPHAAGIAQGILTEEGDSCRKGRAA